jgi:hypothetical protein
MKRALEKTGIQARVGGSKPPEGSILAANKKMEQLYGDLPEERKKDYNRPKPRVRCFLIDVAHHLPFFFCLSN